MYAYSGGSAKRFTHWVIVRVVVVVVDVAAQKLPAARAVFNKLPGDSIDVMMRNWQSEVRSAQSCPRH